MINLYSWSMSQVLPTDFQKLNLQREVGEIQQKRFEELQILWNSSGYLIDCDLEYPSIIHEKKRNIFHIFKIEKTTK